MHCVPSQAAITGLEPRRQGAGADGKIVYPDRPTAEAAARELEATGCRPMRAYFCNRSRDGHFHLTTDSTAHRPVTMARPLDALAQ